MKGKVSCRATLTVSLAAQDRRVRVMLRPMDSFYQEFGALVRRARGDRMSQADLARRVGMSRGSIANIEVGRQRIPLHMLTVLARELDVEVASLLPAGTTGEADVVPADRVERLRPEERAAIEKVVRRAREEREVTDGQG